MARRKRPLPPRPPDRSTPARARIARTLGSTAHYAVDPFHVAAVRLEKTLSALRADLAALDLRVQAIERLVPKIKRRKGDETVVWGN